MNNTNRSKKDGCLCAIEVFGTLSVLLKIFIFSTTNEPARAVQPIIPPAALVTGNVSFSLQLLRQRSGNPQEIKHTEVRVVQ